MPNLRSLIDRIRRRQAHAKLVQLNDFLLATHLERTVNRRVPSSSQRRRNIELSNDLYDQPGHLIRRAQQIAVSMFYSVVAGEVTPVQYAVLCVLQEHPGIDQVTLARFCALDTSTAANLAVRLEERGLVERMVPTSSKRFRLLYLTPQGAALLKKLLPLGRVLSRRLLQELNKKERRIFLRLLKKFVHLNNQESRAPLERELKEVKGSTES
jgi:MarR family transcriptional regulator, temperature-dependent positive regulator of motility